MSISAAIIDQFNRFFSTISPAKEGQQEQIRSVLQRITLATLIEKTSSGIPGLAPEITAAELLSSSVVDSSKVSDYLSACSAQFGLALDGDQSTIARIDSLLLHTYFGDLLATPDQITPEELGIIYDQLTHPRAKHKAGLYYTPPEITTMMTKKVFDRLSDTKDRFTILDPACGSGAFLIEAFRQLTCKRSLSPTECIAIIEEQLFGVDRDRSAVQLTRICLAQVLFEGMAERSSSSDTFHFKDINFNITWGNSLLSPDDLKSYKRANLSDSEIDSLQLFDWKAAFPDQAEGGGFDVILGNPPYGLSRDQRIHNIENELLKDVYKEYRTGKINTYLAFMARSYQLLSTDGVLCFIVPNAWTGIKSGKKLRELWLRDDSLLEIVSFTDGVFITDPSVEPVIFLLSKKGAEKRIVVTTHQNNKYNDTPPTTTVLSHNDISLNPDNTIPLNWGKQTGKLVRTIRTESKPLQEFPEFFQPRIALQAYSRGKGVPPQSPQDVKNHIYHSSTRLNDACYPYLEGADVKRFEVTWSGKYLHYGKWLAEPQTLNRFQHPRIVIREIIGPPSRLAIAALADTTALYNKSILHINAGPKASEIELYALLGLINSSTGSFILSRQGRKSQRRLFPKLVNDDLKHFPVPNDFWFQLEPLAAAVQQITESTGKSYNSNDQLSAKERELNSLVAAAYNLSPAQQKELEAELQCLY